MANFIIRGMETTWPGVPFSTLQAFEPVPNSHLAIWRTHDPIANLYLRMHLTMLQRITAIDRLYQFDLDDGTMGALFDYLPASSRLLSDLDNYLRILCGTKYRLICPWRVARHEDAEKDLQSCIAMDEQMIEFYRDRAKQGKPIPREVMERLRAENLKYKEVLYETMAVTEGDNAATPAAKDGATYIVQEHEK